MPIAIMLLFIIAAGSDEPIVADPLLDYLAHPGEPFDNPRQGKSIEKVYRIEVDFRGTGKKDVLLSDEGSRFKGEDALGWTVYQPTDGGYIRRMNGLMFTQCAVEATPGRPGKAILIYERWGPEGGTVTALRMNERGFVDLPKQIVREVDPGTEEGARYLQDLFKKGRSAIETIDVSHIEIPPRAPEPVSPPAPVSQVADVLGSTLTPSQEPSSSAQSTPMSVVEQPPAVGQGVPGSPREAVSEPAPPKPGTSPPPPAQPSSAGGRSLTVLVLLAIFTLFAAATLARLVCRKRTPRQCEPHGGR
jgi:hypothetical protein